MTLAYHDGTLVADEAEAPIAIGSQPGWGTIALAWAVPAVLSVLQSATNYALHVPLSTALPWALLQGVKLYSWCLTAPVILAAGRRFPITRSTWLERSALHFGVLVAVASVYESAWFYAAKWFAVVIHLRLILNPQVLVIFTNLVSDGFMYVVILAAGIAVERDRRLREQQLASATMQTQMVEARMQALKMQLHPHFLFNALHATTVLISEAPAVATSIIVRLGDLLRVTLARAASVEVSLESELELLRHFLDVEQIRFGDRLAVRYDIEADAMHALVPDLILQPLVENALEHGLGPVATGGGLTLRAWRWDEALVLEVEDSGRGLAAAGDRVEGVGLTTTRARLATLYGNRQQLALTCAPSGGTIARVTLPYHTTAEPVLDAGRAWADRAPR